MIAITTQIRKQQKNMFENTHWLWLVNNTFANKKYPTCYISTEADLDRFFGQETSSWKSSTNPGALFDR